MIYFTAHTFKCVCHCRRAMFRVLGMYNFAPYLNSKYILQNQSSWDFLKNNFINLTRSECLKSLSRNFCQIQLFYFLGTIYLKGPKVYYLDNQKNTDLFETN